MAESAFDVHEKFKALTQSGSKVLSFIGSVDDINLDLMIEAVESELEDAVRAKKRLVGVLVESVQNLELYYCKACAASGNKEIFVVITKYPDQVVFCAGNYIKKSDLESIEARIKIINGLPKESLKDLYRGVLDYGSVSSDGGAGLGFIDIARKSDTPLIYNVEPIDQDSNFFTLEISIDI